MATTKGEPGVLRRRLKIALAIAGVTLAPALVMVVITRLGTGEIQGAATWASLPAIASIAAAAGGGRRFAIIVSFVMGLMAPLAIVAGTSPVSGAALMALLALVVGRMSRVGLQKSALMVPVMIAWPLIDPPAWAGQAVVDRNDTAYLLWMAFIFLVGGLIPAVIVPLLLRKRHLPEPTPHSREEAMPYTIMITVLLIVSTYWVLDHPQQFAGAFLIAAILVLAPIGKAQTLRPTLLRVAGTILGSVFVLGIVSGVSSLAVVYLVGLVFIVISLMARFGTHGWIYYVFMTPAAACLNATSLTEVGKLGEQRIIDNAVGGALIILASLLAVGYSHWSTRHGHADNGDEETDRLLETPLGAPAPAAG